MTPFSVNSSETEVIPKIHVSDEMKLLNTYLKNIDDALENKEPQMQDLYTLSQLLLDTAYKVKTVKKDKTFHQDFKSVVDDLKHLSEFSQKNKYLEALAQARSIKNNCSKCHNKP